MPTPVSTVLPGEIHSIGVLIGLCRRCEQANKRLPYGTVQKRLNAAAALAAADHTGRFWTARFPDSGAAHLAAAMLGNPATGRDAAKALSWIE